MTYFRFHRTPAAIGLIMLVAGWGISCGSKSAAKSGHGTAVRPSPVAVTTAPALRDAARAEAEGRPSEALALYESIATTHTAGPNLLPALMGAARLRLSMNPVLHDLTKAREYLAGAASLDPGQPATIPAGDLVALLDEAAALRQEQATLREQQVQQESVREQLDQRAAALRSENRSLKTTIKTLQEELAKKDEALHRAAEKLLDKTPPPR